ncbi:MAG: hypothetical protein Q9M36_04080 [Sulfurovum sp.]|nr:hypothetical protein [Sulfurovum sp.]
MKKILVACIVVLTLGLGEGYTQADRVLDMQKMAQAMQDMQSGLFYNNLDILKDGARDLKKAIINIGSTSHESNSTDVYETWLNNNTAMTKRIQRSISTTTDVIVERFANGDPTQALQEYSKITRECMKCHISLRKW